MRSGLSFIAAVMAALSTPAATVFNPVEYRQGDTVLEGLSVYDTAVQGQQPAVLVVHQWMGLGITYESRPVPTGTTTTFGPSAT